jgi:hypothetical protein
MRAVAPSPAHGLESFNQTTANKSVKSCVQCPGRELNTGEMFDVLGQGIAMLRPISEARKYKGGWPHIAAQSR